MKNKRPSVIFFVLTAITFSLSPTALFAWGCKGHQTIAFIAEKTLTPEAKKFVEKLLRENPIDPQLTPFCGPQLDLLVAASTWPDDIRRQRTNTGPWHYINIPRGAANHDLQEYCGDRGCVTQAIAGQLATLKDKSAEPSRRAEALRFIVHFVGDLHMPLHASNNNDLGGNCVPVNYFNAQPTGHNNSFSPNLHSIWDTAILERDTPGMDAAQLAYHLEERFAAKMESWRKTGIHVEDWAWESHNLAESVVYGELQPRITVETPIVMKTCSDANNIGARMLALHVSVGESYQSKAVPIVQERLAQAGIRLAMILNDTAASASSPN
jgi:hypothetical protein